MLQSLNVDFSEGIYLPTEVCYVNSEGLRNAVIHNINIRTAHHDIILPTTSSAIAVSCKASFSLS